MAYKNPKDRKYENATKYESTPEQKKARAARNAARRMLMKEGKVHKGDGKDVDHKVPVSKGGKNTKGNLRVESVHDNRSFDRNADHSLKKNVPFGKRKK